jgi:hypothetical protein
MMTFNFKTHWRTTTALCIVSTITLATTAYAAGLGGLGAVEQLVADLEHGNSNKGSTKNPSDGVKTASPIKHVIVLIGENRGLDHTFGVYKPKGAGQTISNLLSKGIVNEDGTAGILYRRSDRCEIPLRLDPDQRDAAAEHQQRATGSERDRRSLPQHDNCIR